MSRTPVPISLTAEGEKTLREWPRRGEQRLAYRARRIILLSHKGVTVKRIAERPGTRPTSVSKWRQRFLELWMAALSDAPRSGKLPIYGEETERRVLKQLDETPPDGNAQWNGTLLAKAPGDVSDDQFGGSC